MKVDVAKIVKVAAVLTNAIAGIAIAWATGKQNEKTLETLVDNRLNQDN